MLSQLLLFPKCYIPIAVVTKDPREVEREYLESLRDLRDQRKWYQKLLRALQMPIEIQVGPPTHRQYKEQREIEDRTSVEVVYALGDLQAIGMGPEIDDEPIEWTNDQIVTLHSVLLEESLKTLAAKGNPSEKLDVLKWVFEIDYVAEITVETPAGPSRKTILNTDVPFSFAFCCKLEGMDPANIRSILRRTMPEAVKSFLVS